MFVLTNRIKRSIDKCDIVSFDVFDTLISRNCYKASHIFDIVEKRYNLVSNKKIENFKELRKQAGKIAKEKFGYEEATLEEIYSCIEIDADIEQLRQIEFEVECDCCVCNLQLQSVYEYAKKMGKKIICVSDMYLVSKQIKHILDKNGILVDEIYVSSEYRKKKNTGNLFKELIKKDLKGKKIVHFGDAEKGDFLFPKLLGIKTYLVPKKKNTEYIEKKDIDTNYINNSILYSLANNKKSETSLYNFGYEVLGPLCLDFCVWIRKNTEPGYKKLFCARDMKIIMEYYNIIFPDEEKDNYYFYVSRRSLRLPYLYKNNSYDNLCISLTNNNLKINEILDNLNLWNENIKNKLQNYNIDVNKKYKKSEIVSSDEFKRFYSDVLQKEINNIGKEQFEALTNYLNNMKADNVVLVDMGWKGTTQKLISNLYENKNVRGLYFGVDSESNYKEITPETARGYLFNKEQDIIPEAQLIVYSCRDLFEKLFAARHGTTIRYSYKKQYELSQAMKKDLDVEILHKGIIEFANDVKKYISDLTLDEPTYDYGKCLFKYLTNPKYKTSKIFGEIINDNMFERKMASPRKIYQYLFKPSLFKKDLKECGWKVGFMKRLVNLPIPYYRVYRCLVKRKGNKDV